MPVPAAHTPIYTRFSLLSTGTIASDTGVSMPPTIAATSSAINSRAAINPLGGLDSSSRCTSTSVRPPRSPPLALISSIASCSPRVIASPDCADAPDNAAIWPILIGSAAKAVVVPSNAKAAPIIIGRAYANCHRGILVISLLPLKFSRLLTSPKTINLSWRNSPSPSIWRGRFSRPLQRVHFFSQTCDRRRIFSNQSDPHRLLGGRSSLGLLPLADQH